MPELGLLILGAFVGYIILHCVHNIKDWNKPLSILSGILSAAVAGGLFTLISSYAETSIGDAIYYYPIGLGYGALCKGLAWTADSSRDSRDWLKITHIVAFAVATIMLLGLLFSQDMRDLLSA